MPESTGSTRSGTRNSSPGSISGGCPRRVGNDRSGLVVWRAEPSSDGVHQRLGVGRGVSIVPAGTWWSDRNPSVTSAGASRSIRSSAPSSTRRERRREREVQLRRGGVDPDVVRPRGHRVGVAAGEQRAVAAAGLDNSDARDLDGPGLDGHARVDREVVGVLGARGRLDRSVGVHLELRVLDVVRDGEPGRVGQRVDVDAHGEDRVRSAAGSPRRRCAAAVVTDI